MSAKNVKLGFTTFYSYTLYGISMIFGEKKLRILLFNFFVFLRLQKQSVFKIGWIDLGV